MGYQAPVSEVAKWHKGSELIGDTLFINGSPHIYCAICGKVEKKFNGVVHTTVVNGRKQKQIVTYKVMVGFWKKDIEPKRVGLDYQLVQTVKPIIHQEPACFDCWSIQEDRKASNPGKAVFFTSNEVFKEKG